MLTMAIILAAANHGWSHHRINSYTYEIFGARGPSYDRDRMVQADRLCAFTGWESDSAALPLRDGSRLKWRIVCKAR
jgi:hypothetical protein